MFTTRAALIAAFALIVPLPAFADESPPAAGSIASFQTVVCDTSEQITAIVSAAKDSPDAGGAKYREFNATKDAKGEPVCAFQPLINILVGDNTDLGKAQLVAGHWVHAWSIHVGTTDHEGWILYLTGTAAPAPTSLDAPSLLPNGLRAI